MINFQRLKSHHDLTNFKTYETELKNFLIQDALNNQNKKISVTYLLYNNQAFIGYITLLNDRINLEGEIKKRFMVKNILYRSLPALKIGRLCVDDKFHKKGYGKILTDFSIEIANSIFQNHSGFRFIVLDTKMGSVSFYKKQKFKALNTKKKETIPMYFDLVNDFKIST